MTWLNWCSRFAPLWKGGGPGFSQLIVPMVVCVTPLLRADDPAPPKPLTAQEQARLKERDRYLQQANAAREAGRLDEALAASEKMVAVEREVLGPIHADVAESLKMIAVIQQERADFAGSDAALKQRLELMVRLHGVDHWIATDARQDLANNDRLARLLAVDRKRLEEANRLGHQSVTLYEAGKFSEALVPGQQAAAIRKALLGEFHPDYATSLNNLAAFCEAQGNSAKAEPLYREALEIRKQVLGENHPDYATSLNNLANFYKSQEDHARAAPLFRAALEIRKKVLGEKDPHYADSVDGLAASLLGLGNVQSNLRDFEAARKSYEEALAICRKALPADHPDIASILNNLGSAQDDLRDFEAARKSYEESLTIRRKALPANHPEIAESLYNLGNLQQDLQDFAAARKSHEEALAIRRKVLSDDHPDIAASLYNLGLVQQDLREFVAARKSHEEALAIRCRSLALDDLRIANSLTNLGNVQRELLEFAAARKSHEEALAIRRRALPADHPDIAASLNNLGNVQWKLRDFAAARKSHEDALAIRRKALPADHPDIATSLNNLGDVQPELRDFEAARKSYEEALAIRRRTLPADHPDIAHSLNNLGILQRELREFAAARRSHEEALEIRRKALPADHPDTAASLNNLGVVQQELREFAAARKSYEEALAIRRRALDSDHPDVAQSLDNLGVVQRALREFAAARKSHEEALAIRRKALPADHPDIAASLNNLGNLQYRLRDFTTARKSHEEALEIRRKALPADHLDIAQSITNLARLEIETGTDVARVVPTWLEACDIFQENQLRLAIAQAEQEQIASAVQVHLTVGLLVAAVVRSGGDPATAYDRAVRAKGSVTAQQRWARRLRDSADPETRRLLDQLRQDNQQLVSLSMADRSSRTGTDAASDLPARIQELSSDRSRLERELGERSPVFESFQARGRIGTAQIQAALPAGTALVDLVEYWHIEPAAGDQKPPSYENRLGAFVVRPDRPEVALLPLGSANEISELIEAWRARYGAGGKPVDKSIEPPAELRKRLWEPLAGHLEGVKVVLISPDGPVNGLPWAALPGSKPGTYMVHEYAFAIVPVPQLLPELMQGKPRLADDLPSLLLAGGIDFGSGPPREALEGGDKTPFPIFGLLSGTESEVNDLRAQYEDAFPDAPAPKRLSRDRATKQAVLAALPTSRFAHLATHGFFAESPEPTATELSQRAELVRGGMNLRSEATVRNPGLLSGLVFAGVNRADRPPEETILTALEASELELGQVELVVLSACETGLGRAAGGGEGVLGLQRALQVAGARSVVASLWRVPDEETHQLMREFYRRVWSADAPSKAEALRQAQLWMIANAKPGRGFEREAPTGPLSPFFWAAFVLSGDWR